MILPSSAKRFSIRRFRRRSLYLILFAFLLCFLFFSFVSLSRSFVLNRSFTLPATTTITTPNEDETNETAKQCAYLFPLSSKDSLLTLNELRKLDTEINSAWNRVGSKVLVVGTAGYIKRDLPVYDLAFSKLPAFQVANPYAHAKKSFKPELQASDFDVLLCLSFNTDLCLTPDEFSTYIPRNKKMNRINHLRQVIWSKHSFCNTLNRATMGFQEDVSFYFPCWVLPEGYSDLMANQLELSRWISKPRSLGAGMGIAVLDSLEEVNPRSNHVIQAYLTNPHLLKMPDGMHKWDMRTYVLVTSTVPLRAYLFTRGLVRLAMTPYSTDCKSHNQTACLTNTSINKKLGVGSAKDITWSFDKLKNYLGTEVYQQLFARIKTAVGMTLLASLGEFISLGSICESCFQLLGVDVIVDDELNPKVIECNGEPSMQMSGSGNSKSHYDTTKKRMIDNLVNLVFHPHAQSAKVKKVLTSRCGYKTKVGKADASYLLDLFREQEALGDFSRIYPPLVDSDDLSTVDDPFRSFLLHMSLSPRFSKKTSQRLKEVLHSHDIFVSVLAAKNDKGANDDNDDV